MSLVIISGELSRVMQMSAKVHAMPRCHIHYWFQNSALAEPFSLSLATFTNTYNKSVGMVQRCLIVLSVHSPHHEMIMSREEQNSPFLL